MKYIELKLDEIDEEVDEWASDPEISDEEFLLRLIHVRDLLNNRMLEYSDRADEYGREIHG